MSHKTNNSLILSFDVSNDENDITCLNKLSIEKKGLEINDVSPFKLSIQDFCSFMIRGGASDNF